MARSLRPLLMVMVALVLPPAAEAQARLVPPAPRDEPKYPLRVYEQFPDHELYGKFRPHRLRFGAKGYKPHLAWRTVTRVSGWRTVTVSGDSGKSVELPWESLWPRTAADLDVYSIRGRVERLPQADDVEEKFSVKGWKSLLYLRARYPYADTGGPSAIDRAVEKLPFLMFEPKGAGLASRFDAGFPVVLYLHGIGGTGDDNLRHYFEDGGGADNTINHLISDSFQKYMPCFVIAPQSWLKNNWWSDTSPPSEHAPTRLSVQLIDLLKARYGKKIDLKRLYVTGLSGGGFGCYEILRNFPGKFAAAAPVAAFNDELYWFTEFSAAPVYLILNEKDPTIQWKYVRWEGNLYKKWGVERRLRIYEGATGHNTWKRAYGDAEFQQWLARQALERVTWPSDPAVYVTEEDDLRLGDFDRGAPE